LLRAQRALSTALSRRVRGPKLAVDDFAAAGAAGGAGPARLLSWPALAVYAYALMCGGAYGIEQAVGSGGAALVIAGLGVLSLVYALPQALMVAELSAAFPVSGSSLYWVEAGLGERWALVNAASLSLGMVFDAAIWPGLLTSYASALVPVLAADARVALGAQAAAVALACGANVVGLRLVVPAVAAATAVTVAPFVLLLPAAWGARAAFDAAAAAAVPALTPAGGALFATTLI